MVLEREILINSPIETAWQLLGPEFAHAYKWASAVNHSEGKGIGLNGSSCSERGCETTIGKLKEKLLDYSAENYSLSYQLAEGMPSMVKYATNTWQLTKFGPNRIKLKINMEFRLGGLLGWFMQPMMKLQLNKLGKELVEDFKHYVETGKPHPRKLKAIRQYEAAQLKAA